VAADPEFTGPMIGLTTGDDAVPNPEEVSWLPLPTTGFADSTVPKVGLRDFYLVYRYQWKQSIVADVWAPCEPQDPEDPLHPELRLSFRGWLKGLRTGTRRFLLLATRPGGPMERVTYRVIARDALRIERRDAHRAALRRARDSQKGEPSAIPVETEEPLEYFGGREDLCRELTSKILMYVYMGKNPDDCPSEEEDPEPLIPPPSLV